MKAKSKQAIRAMIKALKRFEKCQSIHRIEEIDWIELSRLIGEKDLPLTWNDMLRFREGLEAILAELESENNTLVRVLSGVAK